MAKATFHADDHGTGIFEREVSAELKRLEFEGFEMEGE